jgi:hypothetical protein
MSDLKQRSADYFATIRARGGVVIAFNCPICNGVNETKSNDTDTPWDTIATCVECEDLFKKVTLPCGGDVVATLPNLALWG